MMKITVNLPTALVAEAKQLAARRGTTLRAIVEQGVRQVVEDGRFRLKDRSVSGHGLQPEFRNAPWSRIRDAAYER